MIDINRFRLNQSRLPPEEWRAYDGQYVAWSPDGTRVIAAHQDAAQVDAMLQAGGYDPAEILVSRVAFPEEVSWSGWSMADNTGQS